MILVWNKDCYVIHVSLKYAEKREREGIFSMEFHEKVSFISSTPFVVIFFLITILLMLQ